MVPSDKIPGLFDEGVDPGFESEPSAGPPKPPKRHRDGSMMPVAKAAPSPPKKAPEPEPEPQPERKTEVRGSDQDALSFDLDYGTDPVVNAAPQPTGPEMDAMEFDPISSRAPVLQKPTAAKTLVGGAEALKSSESLAAEFHLPEARTSQAPKAPLPKPKTKKPVGEIDLSAPSVASRRPPPKQAPAPKAAARPAPSKRAALSRQAAPARPAQPSRPPPAASVPPLEAAPSKAQRPAQPSAPSRQPARGPGAVQPSSPPPAKAAAGEVPSLVLDAGTFASVAEATQSPVQSPAPAQAGSGDLNVPPAAGVAQPSSPPSPLDTLSPGAHDPLPSLAVGPPSNPAPDLGNLQASPAPAQAGLGGQAPDPTQIPGMPADVGLGALDDLEFGGGAQMAQMDVAVPMASADDSTPWPTGLTPSLDELDLDPDDIEEAAGFGEAPKGIWNAPGYAMRVFFALRPLQEQVDRQERHLREIENGRDERLAQMAEELRPELQGKDRFAVLYSAADKHDSIIAERRRTLEAADMEGAGDLREVQTELDAMSAERLVKVRARDEQKAIVDACAVDIDRARAQMRRLMIEERNLEKKAQTGEMSKIQFDARMEIFDAEKEEAADKLNAILAHKKQLDGVLEEVEDALRLTVADYQRVEGKKEGLLMAYEGDIAVHSKALDSALLAKQKDLADAGRVILDLRGDVPVERELRVALLATDQAVLEAAREYYTSKQGLAAMEPDMYSSGKAVWIGSAAAVFVLLLIAWIF